MDEFDLWQWEAGKTKTKKSSSLHWWYKFVILQIIFENYFGKKHVLKHTILFSPNNCHLEQELKIEGKKVPFSLQGVKPCE